MAKNYLEISDNVIEKSLLIRTKKIGEHFYNASQEINDLQKKIIQFYADKFTNGNYAEAEAIIGLKKDYKPPKDIAAIYKYLGGLAVIIPINIYLCFLPDPK